MGKPINKSDIVSGKPFDEISKEVEKALQTLNKYDEELRNIAKSYDALNKINKKTLDGISKINKAEKESERVYKQKLATEKELIRIEADQEKLRQLKERGLRAEAKEKERLNRLEERRNKNLTDETNAYKRLVKQTRDYKNESKRLGAELLNLENNGKRNTKAYSDLNKAYKRVTASAKAGDAQLKKLDATVGDNFRKVGNYENATRRLSSALGQLGIAFGIGQIVRGTTNVIVDFDQAVTDLSAISGKSKEELSGLTEQAKQLGATTQFTASEITGLQIELAKLGFTAQQIMQSTGGIANFAAATGVEIPRAAKLAGSALRAFNLEAKEIDRVVSTLGVATTKTALDFQQLETGLSTVAPVANAFGFSIEDTTALLGQLSNAGFDASSSATATRNILLNLADANGDLAKELGRPIKNSKDLAEALKELDERGIDLSSSLELTDKRSVAAFNTFLKGAETLPELTESITDVSDELQIMAEKRLDSVSGQFKLLNSALEGYILKQSEAGGVVDKFKNLLGFLAENLGTIFNVLGKVTRAFLVYKSVIIGLKLGKQIRDFGLLAVNVAKYGRASKDAESGTKGFGKSFKSINWASFIAVAVELAIAFYDIASGAKAAREAQENLDNYRATASEQQSERSQKRQQELRDEITLIDQRLRREEITAEQASKLKEKESKETEKAIKNDIDLVESRINQNEKYLNVLDKVSKRSKNFQVSSFQIQQALGGTEKQAMEDFTEALEAVGFTLNDVTTLFGNYSVENFDKAFSDLNAKIGAGEEKIKGYNEELKSTIENTIELETQTVELNKSQEDNSKKINATVKGLEEENKKLKEKKRLVADIDEVLNSGKSVEELQSEEFNQELEFLEKQNKETEKSNIEKAKTQEEFDKLELERQIEFLEDKIELQKIYGQDSLDTEIELAKLRQNFTIKNENNFLQEFNDVQRNLTDVLQENIDRRIELRQQEANEAKSLQDFYAGLAESGNITAKESLAEQIKIEREALEERQRLERQAQKLEMISQGLSTFTAQIDQGKTPAEALTTTITSTTALIAFLSNINAFAKGTKNAPNGIAIVDELGAELITDKKGKIKQLGSDKGARFTKLDAGDRVYTAQQTKQILDVNNANNIKSHKEVAGNSYDLMRLEKLMQENVNATKNAQGTNVEWATISKGIGEIIETKTKGGSIIKNRYRVK
jgi:TP901 family phage tail tape measure protein